MEQRRLQGEAPERVASGVLIARQLGLQALWMVILGFRAEKGHVVRIKRHERREGAGEGAGAEAAPGLPLWGSGGCWERLLPLGLGVGAALAAGQARPAACTGQEDGVTGWASSSSGRGWLGGEVITSRGGELGHGMLGRPAGWSCAWARLAFLFPFPFSNSLSIYSSIIFTSKRS